MSNNYQVLITSNTQDPSSPVSTCMQNLLIILEDYGKTTVLDTAMNLRLFIEI